MLQASDTFSVCFNMLKIKYVEFDKMLTSHHSFINPGDSVNVFINLESVLRTLSSVKDLERRIYECHKFPDILTSNIVNLAAHYRRFFRGNGLDTRVIVYYTDLSSDSFNEYEYNEDYRSYYLNKYCSNPRYVMMGEILQNEVFPKVKTVMDFIPGVYLVGARNTEGSLVPLVVGGMDSSRKNVILSSDIVETQYEESDGYLHFLLKRNSDGLMAYHTKAGYLSYITKKGIEELAPEIALYKNNMFYVLLLACIGEKYRNVEGIPNLKNASLIKLIEQGISDNKITLSTEHRELVKNIFPEVLQDPIVENLRCLNLKEMSKELTERQLYSIKSQLVDRIDNNSLMNLNGRDFYEFPIMLEALTM